MYTVAFWNSTVVYCLPLLVVAKFLGAFANSDFTTCITWYNLEVSIECMIPDGTFYNSHTKRILSE
uniref:Uncharacterized protein n=1 Tax=Arundo donax TaxID=35708 RepID=A0A0A9DF19_ARUDO